MTPYSPIPRRVRQRDTARAAVYAAENQVARILDRSVEHPVVDVVGSHLTLPPERHFGDLAGVQRYVDAVLGLDWVRRQWPKRALLRMKVRERRGASKAHYEVASATVAVPIHRAEAQWALREMVLLHEIAHHLGGPDDPDHSLAFTDRMIELLDGIIGGEVALLLRVALADQNASSA
ncbi:MAG: TIGR04338 family metallohydrolase [Nakamurella sp.]